MILSSISRKTPGHGEKCTKTAKRTRQIFKISNFVQKSLDSTPGASLSGEAPIGDSELFRRLDRAEESGRGGVPGEAVLAGPDGFRGGGRGGVAQLEAGSGSPGGAEIREIMGDGEERNGEGSATGGQDPVPRRQSDPGGLVNAVSCACGGV
jgi:hypothetical protein